MVQIDKILKLYSDGHSIPEIAVITGTSKSTIRKHVKLAGITRSKSDGINRTFKKRVFTEEWKKNLKAATQKYHAENAKGTRIRKNGYLCYTMGEFKGRHVHDVIFEKRLGRKLLKDECIHHIDGNKTNNDEDNLALMTLSGHARHHRIFKKDK